MQKMILLFIVGLLLGFFCPAMSQKLIAYKEEKKGYPYPDRKYTVSMPWKLGCALLAGSVLGACGYLDASWLPLILIIALSILGIVMILVDWQVRIIANETILAMLALALVFQVSFFGIKQLPFALLTMVGVMALWLFIGAFLGFWKVGAGDVKLAAAIGLIFGFPDVEVPLLVMAVALLIYCVIGFLTKRITRKSTFPMAPFLVVGMLIGFPFLFL